jgi:protein gp37
MKTTKIEWTDATWNPSIGCSKVTAGCKNCYAEVMARRLKAMGVSCYEDGFKFKILPERLFQPMNVKNPTKFFVNSMSDLFHKNMPFEFLDEIFEVIKIGRAHV